MKNYVLDACALIAFLTDEEGAEQVEKILVKASSGQCLIFMNTINLLEIYYGIYREAGEKEAKRMYSVVQDLPIIFVSELISNIFEEAGRLKATYKISLADSIVLAQAIEKNAALLTADHHEFDIVQQNEKIKFIWIR